VSSATQAAARGTARPGRRAFFATLVLLVATALLALALHVLAPGGWSVPEALILLCLVANLPWLALAAGTGITGLAVRLSGVEEAAPEIPIALRTLIAVCVRDEPMEALLPSLGELLDALRQAGHGDLFAIAILSDTADPAHAEAEEEAVRRLAAARPPGAVLYRRRTDNAGYKAGNVMEFLDHHAEGFALMVLLDADSQMTPAAVLRLVRAMQAAPRLGILQFPITGRPSRALFGRLFDVGHRASGLTWTLGQAWWQGDEGPFWGHNAAIRIAPFRAHCRLSPLPDGSHILSHDHVEAARLHAAGWGVRVLPATPAEAEGSRESHPPHLLAFLDRDWRWAAGNLQYRHLLRDRSLSAIGRFQMFQAILHYLLSPLWFAMLPLAALNAATDGEGTPRAALILLLVLGYAALHLPRLSGHVVAMLRGAPGGRAGHFRLILAEAVFLLLFQPVHAFHSTMIVLSHALGLPRVGWPVQQREERRLGWGETAACLWPHSTMGLAILALLVASGSGFALAVGLPLVAGLVLAIPFCVLTSIPAR
jgi:membrane glycosyltransferase